ncbi:metal-dependent hydrolase family protein [Candidatus Lucifugimonas marina]|jgi:imidazolonepropionase-like amidohydrolase|uniref:Amidohydrolase family protein n=1 Tax=Candidatus Lucifugimonas marina TaxID=3038979 RepID=A0AAJ5ZB66_9CHLR|nr:amidohydrolase family protein [SAR202 cluster bacterium JH702]MDG0869457.1 amidohydrolase family protein [SAR202 cluster bacterium JH639]WFG34198.1 amidohydrolase family protein [SAR202 cluster bacterium JH545]WFG38127.1 amidohydrolase family protein [SAR202 cluster bacterium JH1073]
MKTMTNKSIYKAKRVANADVSGWLEDHAVVVEDGVITAVEPSDSVSDDANEYTVHDLGDVSLLPGLVDAHSHMHCSATHDAQRLALTENNQQLTIRATNNMRKAVLAGTTTIRDLGSKNEVAFAVRQMIDDGHIPGPRLLLAGTPITITAGHCWFFGTEADTEAEVRTAVRTQVKLGANVIKMMATGGMFTPTANPRTPQYSVEMLKAAVEEAHRMNVPIVTHTLSAQGTRNVVEAGVDHLIHSRWYHSDPTKGLDYTADTVKQMADQGQWVDPTIGHHLLGQEAKDRGEEGPADPHWAVSFKVVPEADHLETLNNMHDAGVRFTTGLDMGMAYGTHDRSAANAWALVEYLGWANWKAINAATAGTAEALGLNKEIGSLQAGMNADLAAFAGDPAKNIRDMDRASTVVQAGRLLKLNDAVLV